MRSLAKVFWLAIFAVTSVGFVFGATASQTLNLPEGGLSAVVEDDTDPEVTDRVARISFVSGDVKIRRVGSEDWEKAVLNLPLIEGDQIATGDDARVEIQLNSYSHIRLDRNAFLKFSTLKYDGIAVSLSQGTMAVRITDLEKAGGFFEIDAPNTTVAIQKAGSCRIDAGQSGDQDLRVSVAGGGEARVYSDNAGFTLKSGRGARVTIGGANAGEWETLDIARLSDEFDSWSQDRDSTIAKRLKDAYYDKYYDQDIYGADDLNGYGDWVHTSNYGYVWQPYNTSINSYVDWSPYRYGHWRWVGAYGWTWVNDEPWGWATYHHGRWLYYNGRWVWAPYGYYRQRRSWWSPALVVINLISTNVYWYPLPYNCNYYGWNHNNWGWGGNGNGHGNGNGPGRGPKGFDPTRKPPIRVPGGGGPTGQIDPNAKGGGRLNPGDTPPIGVITLSEDDFGTTAKGGRRAPDLIAKEILTKDPTDISNVRLPDPTAKKRPVDRDIIATKPRFEPTTKIGAAERQNDKPLDQELRQKRIYGDRPPVVRSDRNDGPVQSGEPTDKRPTGAVERQKPVKRDDTTVTTREPVYTPQEKPREQPTTRQPRPEVVPEYKPPVRQAPKQDPPVYSPPVRQEPRKDPPTRQPTPRSDPPPTKSEPKPTDKPARQPDSDRKKDN